jgi:hypothetical protein
LGGFDDATSMIRSVEDPFISFGASAVLRALA